MSWIRDIYEKIKQNAKVKNHSSHALWVIETTSSQPTAHKLLPGKKSPPDIDADGIKRVDDKPIENHPHWWKIRDFTTADIYNEHGNDNNIKIDVLLKKAVSDDEFGIYVKDHSEEWGEPIANITQIKRAENGNISEYFVEQYGWISKSKAVELAAKGKIDNATPVFPKKGEAYLRSRPDASSENNLDGMIS